MHLYTGFLQFYTDTKYIYGFKESIHDLSRKFLVLSGAE